MAEDLETVEVRGNKTNLGAKLLAVNDEHSAYKWVSPEEMKDIKGLDPFVKQLLGEGKIQ